MTTSRDMTARLFTLHPLEGFRPKTFAGHKDVVLNAYFAEDGKTVRVRLNTVDVNDADPFLSLSPPGARYTP